MRNRPKPAPIKLDTSRITHLEVPFKFLTYVFGGGVDHVDEAEHPMPSRPFDPITPVRATGVRGQLRFWWRATTGSRCGSLTEMREREAAIWGGIWDSGDGIEAGNVGISVASSGATPEPVPIFGWESGKRFPRETEEGKAISYAAFPMRPQGNNGRERDPRSSVWNHSGAQYVLSIDILDPTYSEEIELAVSAWLIAGGYGGRTTRGFGSVALASECPDTILDTPQKLRDALAKLGTPKVEGVPSLVDDESHWAFANGGDPHRSWENAIKKLQNFRQGPGLGRNPGQQHNRPGRSRWPEPDAIRTLTRRSSSLHSDRVHQSDAFPRADFGMPIIFHFKDRGEPDDQTLQPSSKESRLPSPLIIKPIADGRGMALRLSNIEVPDKLYLSGVNREVHKSVRRAELETLPDHQKRLLDPDPVTAFMNEFRSK